MILTTSTSKLHFQTNSWYQMSRTHRFTMSISQNASCISIMCHSNQMPIHQHFTLLNPWATQGLDKKVTTRFFHSIPVNPWAAQTLNKLFLLWTFSTQLQFFHEQPKNSIKKETTDLLHSTLVSPWVAQKLDKKRVYMDWYTRTKE